ncbi:MAG: methionyl-tRNA formyltransferase [Pedosphaera sp.]|nr:methionyl-tRNA formyltransferase [Pedosphaera sp.]MST00881.1 methionyl-tRNA formyltransferase [Pedosphaera sp.]
MTRIVFMGTAELACASLRALVKERASLDAEVVAVVTQPDRPKGRDLKPQPSFVKQAALELGLPVLQPERARNESFIAELRALRSDLIVVVAYGQILPPAILDLPHHGCLNVHTSLLPKYRGAAPIQWAIANGDAETGVTIMKMDPGLDTGPILAAEATPITAVDDAVALHNRLAQLGAALLVRTIFDHTAGRIVPQTQPVEGASYARKVTKEDGRLDWTQPAGVLWNHHRAFTPWPGSYTFLPGAEKNRLLKVCRMEPAAVTGHPGEILAADKGGIVVGCAGGALRLVEVQREGSRRLSVAEFLAGFPLQPAQRFG